MSTVLGASTIANAPPSRPLLVAYGNPLRGDDGIGWRVAAAVRAAAPPGAVHVLAVHQLTPELAEIVARAERVVFVDASCVAVPGSVELREVEPAADWIAGFSHRCEPSEILAFAETIFGRAPTDAWLLTVGGVSFDALEELSAPVAHMLPRIVEAAMHRLLPIWRSRPRPATPNRTPADPPPVA